MFDSINKYKKDLFVILLCFFLVGGFAYIHSAQAVSSQVQFTTDAIVSLSGISDGDLYVASSSECTSLDVSGSALSVMGILSDTNFTLKTPTHDNALSIAPSGDSVDLDFDSSHLSSGNITQWILDSSGSPEVSFTMGTEKANTYYEVQVDGSALNSYQSNASGEISFSYSGGFSTKTFTVSEDNTAPESFSLASPTNGENISAPVDFSWNASTNPDLDHYELYIDGSQKAGNISGDSYTSSDSLSCGSHNWYVKAVDKAGNITSSNTFSFDIGCSSSLPPSATQPLKPPEPSPDNPDGGFNISIDQGKQYTSIREVILHLFGSSETEHVALSSDPDFPQAGLQPYSSTMSWTLSPGEGKKTVYAKFYDRWGHSSDVVSDSIILTNKGTTTNSGETGEKSNRSKEEKENVPNLAKAKKETVERVTQKEAETVMNRNSRVSLNKNGKQLYSSIIGLTNNKVSQDDKFSIVQFLYIGTPSTQRLGAGERAGVLHSYHRAFNKLPDNQQQWQDVIKIANGRWPSRTNDKAEANAQDIFQEVYDRSPETTDIHDQAAVTVIAYGLRPANRNMESERRALRFFQDIYDHNPEGAKDWNIVRAIAYSGAEK